MYYKDRIKQIIEKINTEKGKGGTFDEIAKEFNSDDFPTVYGKKWTGRNLFNYYQKHK